MKKLFPQQNTGVIITPLVDSDFIAGGISGIIYKAITDGDWEKWLPLDEFQSTPAFDTMSCLSFSALHLIETQINRLLFLDLIPKKVVDELNAMGFIKGGLFNASARFTAKMSGTTTSGNSFQNVWNSIRHDGLVPESQWSFTKDMTWKTFYTAIPKETKALGKRFLELFDIQYEWVNAGSVLSVKKQKELVNYHLRQAPLQIATGICSNWNNIGIVSKCLASASHATTIYKPITDYIPDFDQYEPYKKKLAVDYQLLYIMKGIVSLKPHLDNSAEKKTMFQLIKKKGKPEVCFVAFGKNYLLDDMDKVQKGQEAGIFTPDIIEQDNMDINGEWRDFYWQHL